jgi:hypothetical protein
MYVNSQNNNLHVIEKRLCEPCNHLTNEDFGCNDVWYSARYKLRRPTNRNHEKKEKIEGFKE